MKKTYFVEYKMIYTMHTEVQAESEEEAIRIASESPEYGHEADVTDTGYIAYEVMEESDEEVHSNGN
jgi:hypothetical protein